MNDIPDNSIVVIDITSNTIEIIVSGEALIEEICNLGFVNNTDFFSTPILSEDDKIEKIRALIVLNALFSFGYGWYPSEVVAYYKDQGVDFGTYKVIRWIGKGDYRIDERD